MVVGVWFVLWEGLLFGLVFRFRRREGQRAAFISGDSWSESRWILIPLALVVLCDIVIASEKASIGDPHVRVGLVAGDGGAVIWPQLIGFNKAKEMLMLGDLIKAADAERLGLINHLVPPEELDDKVYAIAERLANGATKAIRWTKTVTNIPLVEIAHKIMDASIAYETVSNTTADHQEATTAFHEKREPVFKGR